METEPITNMASPSSSNIRRLGAASRSLSSNNNNNDEVIENVVSSPNTPPLSSSSTSSSSSQQQRQLQTKVPQGEEDISILVDNTCQVWTQMNTTYTGDRVSSGTMFSITAKQDVEILTFEFANLDDDGATSVPAVAQPVEVYVKTGADVLSGFFDSTEWSPIGTSLSSMSSPDGAGSIIPTAGLRSVLITAGQSISFYITLTEPRMQLSVTDFDSGLKTGDPYLEDDYIQLNVGIGLRDYPFPAFSDSDRIFHGTIHYKTPDSTGLDCKASFSTTDTIVLKFAIDAEAENVDTFQTTMTNAINSYLISRVELRKMTDLHGLVLNSLTENNLGAASGDACGTVVPFENGCILFEATTNWSHFESITTKKLKLELIQAMTVNMENVATLNAESITLSSPIVYIGDQALEGIFELTLSGVPSGALLNPIQRRYASAVTLEFLENFMQGGQESIYDVVVEQQTEVAARRRHLQQQQRGGDRHRMLRGAGGSAQNNDEDYYGSYETEIDKRGDMAYIMDAEHAYYDNQGRRDLQSVATLKTQTLIYSVGNPDTADDFFNGVKDAFAANQRRYMSELTLGQLRPSEINAGANLGAVFGSLLGVQMVVYVPTNETDTDDDAPVAEVPEDNTKMWILIWSVTLGVSVVWLVCRIAKDYFLVPPEAKIQKKEKLSERNARLEEERKARKEKNKLKRAQKKEKKREKKQRKREEGGEGGSGRRRGSIFRGRGQGEEGGGNRRRRGSIFGRGKKNKGGGGDNGKEEGNKSEAQKAVERKEIESMLNSGPPPASATKRADKRSSSFTGSGSAVEAMKQVQAQRRPSFDSGPRRRPSLESGPRNTAGERGRGVKPSRSMPMGPRGDTGRGPPKRVSQIEGLDLAMDLPRGGKKPDRFGNNSNHSAPRNRAGEGGRGIRANNSMPIAPRSTSDLPGRGGASNHSQQSQGRRDGPPSRNLSNASNHSQNSQGRRGGPPQRNNSNASAGSAPRNMAGRGGRGVRPSLSMPMQKRSASGGGGNIPGLDLASPRGKPSPVNTAGQRGRGIGASKSGPMGSMAAAANSKPISAASLKRGTKPPTNKPPLSPNKKGGKANTPNRAMSTGGAPKKKKKVGEPGSPAVKKKKKKAPTDPDSPVPPKGKKPASGKKKKPVKSKSAV